jgi:hypothetical protein
MANANANANANNNNNNNINRNNAEPSSSSWDWLSATKKNMDEASFSGKTPFLFRCPNQAAVTFSGGLSPGTSISGVTQGNDQ